MCGSGHQDHSKGENTAGPEGMPDWETVQLPPAHILAHLTDAHCHPTDLDQSAETYDNVQLGGIAAMATVPDDQEKVRRLGEERGWRDTLGEGSRLCGSGARAISCFGYHPWFSHRYSLSEVVPSKEDHYSSIFFPQLPGTKKEDKQKKKKGSQEEGDKSNGKDASTDQDPVEDTPRRKQEREQLSLLLPYLPDPVPFAHLLQGVRENITRTKEEGRLVLLGEVGLDGSARVRWPVSARHLYKEKYEPSKEEEGEWRRLTMFKVSMGHQVDILRAQMEVAIDLGVSISLHCVNASGPTMDILLEMRKRFGNKFTNGINVDLHSGGGWSPQFFIQGSKQLSNLYASPSIFITSRLQSATELIRAIPPDRMLVESDSHDVTLSTRAVWAAVLWIAYAKGWTVEGSQDVWKEEDVESDDEWDERGRLRDKDLGVVHRLERNWARFMGLIEPYD